MMKSPVLFHAGSAAILGLVLALAGRMAGAQTARTGLRLLASNHISVDNAARPHVETHIAVDPTDPQHLIAAAMVNGASLAEAYVTFDGGKRWTRGRMLGDTDVVMEADPMVYVGNTGTSFFVALARVKGRERTVIRRSTDGGRTWGAGTILPFADREWMALDTSRAAFGSRIYFTGTGVFTSRDSLRQRAVAPYLAWSDDDGRTFPFKRLVAYDEGGSDPRAPINAVPGEPVITTTGVLVLPLQGAPHDSIIARFSRDSLSVRSLGLVTSNDGGESFGAARYASDLLVTTAGSPARRFRMNAAMGFPRAAIDATRGPFRDRIYMVAPSYEPALDRYVVRVWRTADLGKMWNSVIASDAPRGDVANPAIAVNRDGVVAVIWNDRRDDPKARCWRLYAAISTNGGERFLPAQRLSTKETCTNDPRNWQTFGHAFTSARSGQYLVHFQTGATIPTRFPNGGDTQGLAADATGVFHAAWINGETGIMQLWHTSFRVTDTLVARLRERINPPTDSSGAAIAVPPGLEDITTDVRFHVLATELDFGTRTWTVTLQLENQSGRPLRGPFRAIMVRFLDEIDRGGGLRNLRVANADSGGPEVGAAWNFEVAGGVLAPGARTSPRVLRFSFEGGVPEVPDGGYLSPGFRIYGRSR